VATALPDVRPIRTLRGLRLNSRLVAASAPSGTAAEQYRALRTRIVQADHRVNNVVLITSPGQGDGKSLTASNLGLTMAQEYQRRTCLVDADLRAPQIRRYFGLPEGPGLSDVLVGAARLEEALVTLEDHQLTILPAGHGAGHPAELLGTSGMRRTLETLRTQFDRIVIDAPAAGPLADVGILAPLVDCVVLVVRAGVTATPAIHDAINTIDASKLLGIVLNEAA
jgi:capsular exopolysaccharide synthesis family protein